MRNRCILALLGFSILLGLSPLAADPMIQRGIDALTTRADGKTYYDFAKAPIPAGFFCEGSKAFTGRVALKGLPLTTKTPEQLRDADTIIERLDNAAFDAQGVALTRIQFRALSLVSIAPIKTGCGAFHIYVSLGGKQRVTTMRIHRTQEGGGTFSAPLAVNSRITFIPVKSGKAKNARHLELTGDFTFPARPLPWSFRNATSLKSIGSAVVDTNGDLKPDTQLPGTSNFVPGLSPDHLTEQSEGCAPLCHSNNGHYHCTEYVVCS